MCSVMRLPDSGQRDGGQRCSGRFDGHHKADGTVEISVTSQTAGISVVTAASTTASRVRT